MHEDWFDFIQAMLGYSVDDFLDLMDSVSVDIPEILDEIVTEQFYEKEFDNEDDNIIAQYVRRFKHRMSGETNWSKRVQENYQSKLTAV